MQNIHKIIALLADGQTHSGAEIGQLLDITRSAVWKLIKQAQQLGLSIQSQHSKGYSLPYPLDLLDHQQIMHYLTPNIRQQIDKLMVLNSVDSTHTHLVKHSADDQVAVCVAEQQTSGRGRQGKPWISPYAANIALSISWPFDNLPHGLNGLGLASALPVLNALERYGLSHLQLKWPNDIMANGKKLAGILLEVIGQAGGPSRVLLGVGINTELSLQAPLAINQTWTDTYTLTGQLTQRNRLLAYVLEALIDFLQRFAQQGLTEFLPAWRARDMFYNQVVDFHLGDKRVQGIARGVNDDGALLIETSEGHITSFFSGEIHTLRAKT